MRVHRNDARAWQVRNAQNAGFRAAIVYNDDGDDSLILMGSDGSIDVAIPSVFVGATAGAILFDSDKYVIFFIVSLSN